MKKKISCIVYMILLHLTTIAQDGHYMPGGSQIDPPGNQPWNDPTWKLVFYDDFSGTSVDNTKWEVRNIGHEEASANGSGAASAYRAHNVWVSGGTCKIKITKETVLDGQNVFHYTAGEIRTLFSDNWTGHFFKEGMFEARIKMSSAFWGHQNFWLFGGNDKNPGLGEIDIAEVRGSIHGRQGLRYVPVRVHNYNNHCIGEKTTYGGGDHKISSRTDKDFHTYTCLWDKHYVYFFVDHLFIDKVERWRYAPINANSLAQDWDLIANSFVTDQGYYWNRGEMIPLNAKMNLSLHLLLDHIDGGWPKNTIAHDLRISSPMEIDFVYVYMKNDCDYDEEITNSELFPYESTDRLYVRQYDAVKQKYVLNTIAYNKPIRHLTLGTQNNSTPWKNIAAPWDVAKYHAETITLLPNYICYPELVEAKPCKPEPNSNKHSATLFLPSFCAPPSQGQEVNEYIDPGEFPEPDSIEVDSFDCSGIDTIWVDSTINAFLLAGDTLSVDTLISFIVDSLGCEYWGYGGGGQSKPGRRSDGGPTIQYRTVKNQLFIDRIHIYPNPTTGAFHIEMPQRGNYSLRVMNMLGSTVYEGKMTDEQKKSIQLDNNLPPGNYTLHISGDGLRYVERITLTK